MGSSERCEGRLPWLRSGAAVKVAVILLLVLTLAGRLWVALADHRRLIGADVWQDDAFYYLKIAQNLLGGRGLTFDGHTPTNGFQPLHFALVVPVTLAAPDDPARAMHLLGTLLSLVAAGTGLLVFLLQRRLSGTPAALAALSLWALSPYFTVFGVNGQETGLAILFTVLLFLLQHRLTTRGSGAGWGSFAFAGLVGGLAVLARLDLAILLLAIAIDCAIKAARKQMPVGSWKRLVLAGLVALVVYLPWGLISWMQTGSVMPMSGAASRQLALEYGWNDLDRVWSSPRDPAAPGSPPPAFYADVASKLVGVFALEWPLAAPLRLTVPFEVWPRLDLFALFAGARRVPTAAAGLVILLLLGAVFAVRRAGERGRLPEPGLSVVFGAYLTLFFLGYIFYSPVHWYFSRYLSAPVLMATVWGLHLGRAAVSRPGGGAPWPRRLALAAAISLVLCQAFLAWGWLERFNGERTPAGFLTSWERLGPKVGDAAVIGSFQAGIISYFSGRDVVNLDGKVNPEAYEAIRQRRLHEYIRQKGITYIMDWEWIFSAICLRYAPPGSLRLELVGREPDGAGMSLWRVGVPGAAAPASR